MATYWDEVLADNPTVLLKMQEASGNLIDTQVGNDAVVSGTALTYQVAGPAAGIPFAVTFPTAGLATITDSADIDLGDGPFSIELWIKRPGSGNFSPFKKSDDVAVAGYYMTWSADIFRLQDGSSSNHLGNTPADSDISAFHHWVFTRGSGVSGLCIRDGVDVTNVFAAKTFSDNVQNLIIGQSDRSVGTMAGLAIYKTQLSVVRAAAHYAARDTGAVVGAPLRPPIIFNLKPPHMAKGQLGVPLPLLGHISGGVSMRIFGVTKDSAGVALGTCVVDLFTTANDVKIGSTVSDASGNYEFRGVSQGLTYYLVAYKAGSPDVAGTTTNTLVGI